MSIDDGICILKSRGRGRSRRGRRPEYRVRHYLSGAVAMAWGDPEYDCWQNYRLTEWEADLRRQFANCVVFRNRHKAWAHALRLEAQARKSSPWGQPENAIAVVDIGREFPAAPLSS